MTTPQTLRFTRDYYNIHRDKRRTQGWDGLKTVPAGAFAVWVPAYLREAPDGGVRNAGNTMHIYHPGTKETYRVPHDVIHDLLPMVMNPYTQASEPECAPEVRLVLERLNVDPLDVLAHLVRKNIGLEGILQACREIDDGDGPHTDNDAPSETPSPRG